MRRLLDGAALEAVRAREFLGVRKTIESYGTEAVVIEERLPLAYHPEIAVVHDDDLDREALAGKGGQFGNGHLETAIPDNCKDQLAGAGQLCTESRGQAEAHRAQAAGVEPQARLIEADELRRPHLVLPDVGADDGFAFGDTVDLGHQVLGLDLAVGSD